MPKHHELDVAHHSNAREERDDDSDKEDNVAAYSRLLNGLKVGLIDKASHKGTAHKRRKVDFQNKADGKDQSGKNSISELVTSSKSRVSLYLKSTSDKYHNLPCLASLLRIQRCCLVSTVLQIDQIQMYQLHFGFALFPIDEQASYQGPLGHSKGKNHSIATLIHIGTFCRGQMSLPVLVVTLGSKISNPSLIGSRKPQGRMVLNTRKRKPLKLQAAPEDT